MPSTTCIQTKTNHANEPNAKLFKVTLTLKMCGVPCVHPVRCSKRTFQGAKCGPRMWSAHAECAECRAGVHSERGNRTHTDTSVPGKPGESICLCSWVSDPYVRSGQPPAICTSVPNRKNKGMGHKGASGQDGAGGPCIGCCQGQGDGSLIVCLLLQHSLWLTSASGVSDRVVAAASSVSACVAASPPASIHRHSGLCSGYGTRRCAYLLLSKPADHQPPRLLTCVCCPWAPHAPAVRTAHPRPHRIPTANSIHMVFICPQGAPPSPHRCTTARDRPS